METAGEDSLAKLDKKVSVFENFMQRRSSLRRASVNIITKVDETKNTDSIVNNTNNTVNEVNEPVISSFADVYRKDEEASEGKNKFSMTKDIVGFKQV